MRSFFTSSLDKIDPPTPYVNAMEWDSYRSQFRSEQSCKSGNRDSVLALGSLNPECAALAGRGGYGQNTPFIVENIPASPLTIELHSDIQALERSEVDACFGDDEFLREVRSEALWLESPAVPSEQTFDLELGLLESVQEIAVSLARTPPKRKVLERDAAISSTRNEPSC